MPIAILADLLLLSDVLEMVSADKIFGLQYSKSFCSDIFIRVNNGSFESLEHNLNKIFSSSLLN